MAFNKKWLSSWVLFVCLYFVDKLLMKMNHRFRCACIFRKTRVDRLFFLLLFFLFFFPSLTDREYAKKKKKKKKIPIFGYHFRFLIHSKENVEVAPSAGNWCLFASCLYSVFFFFVFFEFC